MLLEDVVIWNSHQLQCHGRKTALSNGSKEQLAAVFTWRLVILTKTGIKLGFLLPHSLHFKFWDAFVNMTVTAMKISWEKRMLRVVISAA